MKFEEKIIEIFNKPICDNCAGRVLGNLLSGFDNKERGKSLRMYVAFLLESGEKLNVNPSNFHGIKFRNIKIQTKSEKCNVCKNFFHEKIDDIAKEIVRKLDKIEFDSFLMGSIPSDEMLNEEEKLQERTGIEFSEMLKSEINRELGKRIEKLTGRHFDLKSPDVTAIINLNTGGIKTQIKSVYIYGGYQKLARGISQTEWICSRCLGKGCTYCKGEGKLYKNSVQGIIQAPLLKVTKSKDSSLHAAGREDVDARCLAYRPFVIELLKPLKRKFDLRKAQSQINKSKKVKVKGLKFVKDGNRLIRKLKTDRYDKTYVIDVEFEKSVDKKLLKNVKQLIKLPIMQKTPQRVAHRRADKIRKRHVKSISYKMLNSKKIQFKIKTEAGLYIKELASGDDGRTNPNISNTISNKVKKMQLDVIKIWLGK